MTEIIADSGVALIIYSHKLVLNFNLLILIIIIVKLELGFGKNL